VGFILMSVYLNKVCHAMKIISRVKNTLFLGQSVKYSGSSIYASLKDVPLKKSRRDDLISMVYSAMYINERGNLPWSKDCDEFAINGNN
jgi:hypothetical protein